jgi:hypothetical protein
MSVQESSVDVNDARYFALDRHRRDVHFASASDFEFASASDFEVAPSTDGYGKTFEAPRLGRILREFANLECKWILGRIRPLWARQQRSQQSTGFFGAELTVRDDDVSNESEPLPANAGAYSDFSKARHNDRCKSSRARAKGTRLPLSIQFEADPSQ